MKTYRFIVFILSLLFSAGLLLSTLAQYFSPKEIWIFAFLGLGYPIFFIFNLLFLTLYSIQKKKKAFFNLAALLVSLINLPGFIQVWGKENPAGKTEKTINILSFNTHYMGTFDHKDLDTTLLFKTIHSIKPDIMCFQEFVNFNGKFERPMFKMFFDEYNTYYSVNADIQNKSFPTGYGVSIFSKYPIVNKGFLELENQNSNLTVFADVLIGKDTFRIINTHLKSIVFDKEDYKTFEELKDVEESPETYKLRRILAKLKYAFQSRAKQAEKIREKLILSPYKVILCGDFNDSPSSYAYHVIKGKMKDAFVESGMGLSRTYIGKMPNFRIDYILHDPSFKSYNYKTHTLNFSDHKMISSTILLP